MSAARLEGKVAIVTGAARGTGEVISRLFVAHGAQVVLVDIRRDLGEAVAADLGPAAWYTSCDVSQEDDWTRTVTSTVERFGRLDVLVNNAAVLHLAGLLDTTVEDYLRVFRVNELGTFLGIRSVVEPMTAAGGGSIVNISSIDGIHVSPGTSAYAASKFAVRGISKTAALELGRRNIRVNCVCPAAGNVEMVIESLPPLTPRKLIEAGADSRSDRHALGRRGTMEDVAYAALFLASDESSFFTGTDLVLDGGITAGTYVKGAPGTT